jgi:isopentenyl diphosphate isomerase/L-lactate dehydrogenase-like FMN-dependent dehydrogenase
LDITTSRQELSEPVPAAQTAPPAAGAAARQERKPPRILRHVGPTAWFQAYLPGDNEVITRMVERVERAGYDTLVLTVDVPVLANRENNVRTGFSTPLRPSPRLAWDVMDGAAAPIRVLPGIVEQAGAMTVMMDSGVRRGTDVLKALALGAQFVFVGRPFLYAAAVAGEPGARYAISLLAEEIHRDMALIGINRLDEMRRELLMPARGADFLKE